MANLKKKIIIGTWSLTDQFGKIEKKNIEKVIDYAIKKNFVEFDTAPNYGYGQIESILSKFKKNKFSNIKINTKCGNGRDNLKSFKADDILKSIDQSLDLFNKINTVYIHNPRCSEKKIDKVIDILCDYKQKKLVNNIGISIARDFYYDKSILDRFDFIQDEVNVLFFNNLNFLKKIKTKIIARSPLASGCLSGKLKITTKFESQDYRKSWLHGKRLINILKQIKIIEKIFENDIKSISKSFVYFNPKIYKIIFGIKSTKQIDELINDINHADSLNKEKIKELELIAKHNFFLSSKGY